MVQLDYVDKLNDKVQLESENVFGVLQSELIQLKFKSARCARKCFQEKLMPESFKCEKECMQGIGKVKNKMKSMQCQIDINFKQCVERAGASVEGLTEEIMDMESGVTNCYEKFRRDLIQFKRSMISEFSFYE